MSFLLREDSRSTGEVRVRRIGALGGLVAAGALVLALFIINLFLLRAFTDTSWPSGDAATALTIALCVLPIFALVVLSTTGYLAASGADTRPGRSGIVAAGVVSTVHLIVLAGMSVGPLFGQSDYLLKIITLGIIFLLAGLAGGVVMLGVACGVSRWNHDRH